VRTFGADFEHVEVRAVTGAEIDLGGQAHRHACSPGFARGSSPPRCASRTPAARPILAAWWRASARRSRTRRARSPASRHRESTRRAAFSALAAAPAAYRAAAAGRSLITFGETAGAKALYAIRPLAFPPWDAPMRVAFGSTGADGYRAYLGHVADAVMALAESLGVPVAEVPGALGRPDASPPRLVDEYLWMRVNRPGR
jgi:hypothetical protein